MTEWQASPRTKHFTDHRISMRRNVDRSFIVTYKRFKGVAWRKADSGVEEQLCTHGHVKHSVATKCAETLAKRLNREAKKEQQ